MKKNYKNFLLAAAMLIAPAFSWATLKGSGTEADPYLLGTADDLVEMRSYAKHGQQVFFKMTADIDMTGRKDYVPFNSATDEGAVTASGQTITDYNSDYNYYIGFDGDNHLIKGLVCRADTEDNAKAYACTPWYYKSFLGVLVGYIKNVAFTGCVFVDERMGCGTIAGYLGRNDNAGIDTYVENVFIDATIKELKTGRYMGGVAGTNEGPAAIRNCYVAVSEFATDGNILMGGVVGRANSKLTIENVVLGTGKQLNSCNWGGASALYPNTDKTPGKVAFIAPSGKGEVSGKNFLVYTNTIQGNYSKDCPFGDNAALEVFAFQSDVKISPNTKYSDGDGVTAVDYATAGFEAMAGAQFGALPTEFKGYVGSVGLMDQIMGKYGEGMTGGSYDMYAAIYANTAVIPGYIAGILGATNAKGLTLPMPSWVAGKCEFAGGKGTEAEPFLIDNANQLTNMAKVVKEGMTYFKLAETVDFADAATSNYIPAIGADQYTYRYTLSFDGNQKTIKNFAPNTAYTYPTSYGLNGKLSYMSLFGIHASGYVKDLAVEKATIDGNTGGVFSVYCSYSHVVDGAVSFENVSATGSIVNDGYAGGFFGTTGNPGTTLKNVWAAVDVDATGFAGGLFGRANHAVEVNNAISRAATVKSSGSTAGGLIGGGSAAVTGANAISWNGEVIAKDADSADEYAGGNVDFKMTNTYVWDGAKVGGTAVTGGTKAADLLKTGSAWAGWGVDKDNKYPVLSFQAAGVAAVEVEAEVVAYGANGAIYTTGASTVYNMNGQVVYNGNDEVVAVPAGLYIVKVGGKAVKVVVK